MTQSETPEVIRAFVVKIQGLYGKPVSVTFDRYGAGSHVFIGNTDEQARNQAVMSALKIVIREYGSSWLMSHEIIDVY